MNRLRLLGCLTGALSVSALGMAQGTPAPALAAGPPLLLSDAIRLALDNNPDIKVQNFGPAIARANWVAALGQFDPAINFNRSASSSYGYPSTPEPLPPLLANTDNYSLNLGGTLPTGLNYSIGGTAENQHGLFNGFTGDYATFAGINLTQPLLRGFGLGANLVNVRIARANRTISEWQFRQTMINTVTNVVDTYSNLVLAHDELGIAQRSHDLAALLLTQSQQRLKAGQGAQSDVTAARARVAENDESILLEANAVRSIENQLRELIGETSFPPDRPLYIVYPPIPPEVTVDPANDYEKALNNRPDYQAARLGIVIDRASDSAARNGLLPKVNLFWSHGYNGLANTLTASRRMLETEDFPSSSIGVNVSIPITNATARGTARAARLTLEQAQASLREMEANIAVNVANAASQIETARQRVLADQNADDLANQALKDEMNKFNDGVGGSTVNSVIQQQQFLIAADNSLASSKAAKIQAVANYDQALGTTLSRYNIVLAGPK